MKALCKPYLVLSLLGAMCGCSTVGTAQDLAIISRYESTQSYGSLLMIANEGIAGSSRAEAFVLLATDYARSRGITLVAEDDYQSSDSRLAFGLDEYGSYPVTLERKGQILDQLTLAVLDESSARRIIDEMLLLWYSPDYLNQERRPVPENVLQPTFHDAAGGKPGDGRLGWQQEHQLNTPNPLFTWERFPRPWDIPPGMTAGDFRNVRYEFQIHGGERAEDLTEPAYRLTEPLQFCARVSWSVRALFDLNGVPRMTEWSGAYLSFPSQHPKPWMHRRGISRFPAVYAPESAYFFAVRAPHSPFTTRCGD